MALDMPHAAINEGPITAPIESDETSRDPLKILMMISQANPYGAERMVSDLVAELTKNGNVIRAACPRNGWLTTNFAELHIPVIPSTLRRASIQSYWNLWRECMRFRPDVIHCHLFRAMRFGAVLSKMSGIPLVVTAHNDQVHPIYKLVVKSGGTIVAVSNAVASTLVRGGISSSQVTVITNGTPLASLPILPPDDSVREEFAIPLEQRIVGVIAKITPAKGQMDVVRALAKLPKLVRDRTHLMLVGGINSDAYVAEIRAFVEQCGLRRHVTITGVRKDVPRLLSAMEFTVLSSTSEACSMSVIESMAMARPVIALKVGGNVDLIRHDETGLLIDGVPEQLAEAMARLLTCEPDRIRLSRNARQFAQQELTTSLMAQRYRDLFERLTAVARVDGVSRIAVQE